MSKKYSKDEAKRRRDKIFKFWSSLDIEIQPCKFCGRCVLVGVCCTKALQATKKFEYKRKKQ